MLADKRLAGGAPEVNLRNPLHAGDHAGDEACNGGIHQALKPSIDVTQSAKQRYQWPHKKNFKKSSQLLDWQT